MTHRIIPVLLLAGLALGGCGGGKSSSADSAADQIKDMNVKFIQLVRDNKLADACALTTKPQECMSAFALIDDVAAFIPSGFEDKIRDAKVTVNGDSAQLNIDGEVTKMERNGRWRIVP